MSSTRDDRGSKLQTRIFDYLAEIYPNIKIHHEYRIGKLNQRIDIFIPQLGLAVEIDGEQHFGFNKFFHKSELDWNASVERDKRKEAFLAEHGVKLVRIPYNTKIKNKEDLQKVIEDIPYPDNEFIPFSQQSESQLQQDHIKKEALDTQKEIFYSSNAYKDNVKRQKEYRKKAYQISKKNRIKVNKK